MPWFTYILRCHDGTFYTGITTDLDKRMNDHNAKKGAKYTASRGPVVLVWHESHQSESGARKREWQIKQLTRQQKIALIHAQ